MCRAVCHVQLVWPPEGRVEIRFADGTVHTLALSDDDIDLTRSGQE
jgi:hypothetical protein